MRDRSNETVDNIQAIVQDVLENKFLKNSAVFISEAAEYDSGRKVLTAAHPDGTYREVPIIGNTKNGAIHVVTKGLKRIANRETADKEPTKVVIINMGFPNHTMDKTVAMPIFNAQTEEPLNKDDPITVLEGNVLISLAAIRGRYTNISEEIARLDAERDAEFHRRAQERSEAASIQ